VLKIREAHLYGKLKKDLDDADSKVNALPSYQIMVAEAGVMWDKKSDKIFKDIRLLLESMCIGARRCAYCEDSVADEIEHIYPKKFYPELTFKWRNYLFACGQCNGSIKRDQFAIFSAAGGVVDLKRGKNAPVVPPPAGSIVFLDPRVDNPSSIIELDPQTGLFVPLAKKGTPDYIRAEYTLKILGLNTRDYLSKARRNVYGFYVDAINAYIQQKKSAASKLALNKKMNQIKDGAHQSVFLEIGRLSSTNQLDPHFWTDARELWDEYAPF